MKTIRITRDKCLTCTHVAPSPYFVKGICPNCGSSNVDDADTDPYEEDGDEEYWEN